MNYIMSLITTFGPIFSSNQAYFEKNVRPVIEAKCASCHAGMAGQDWTQYKSAKRAMSKINFRVFVLKNMPPMSSPALTAQESSILKSWIDSEKSEN